MMNTLEIDTILRRHPRTTSVFRGVYSRNRLPRILNVPTALVGNTDPDNLEGEHWIAIYIDANSKGEYYDPTGSPPFQDAYVNFKYQKKKLKKKEKKVGEGLMQPIF